MISKILKICIFKLAFSIITTYLGQLLFYYTSKVVTYISLVTILKSLKFFYILWQTVLNLAPARPADVCVAKT